MASESPASKKRKVLQPTIKCFMNSKRPQQEEGDKEADAKSPMGRNRGATRSKQSKGVFRDQPPVRI